MLTPLLDRLYAHVVLTSTKILHVHGEVLGLGLDGIGSVSAVIATSSRSL